MCLIASYNVLPYAGNMQDSCLVVRQLFFSLPQVDWKTKLILNLYSIEICNEKYSAYLFISFHISGTIYIRISFSKCEEKGGIPYGYKTIFS